MELSKMKSNLKMQNLYFSSCSVERACKVENVCLTSSLSEQPTIIVNVRLICNVILGKQMNMNMM